MRSENDNSCHSQRTWLILRESSMMFGHLANTLVIAVTTAVLHNFALIHREQDFVEDIEDENVPFDIVTASDASH